MGDVVEFTLKKSAKGLQASHIIYPNQPSSPLPVTTNRRHASNDRSIFSSLVKLVLLCMVGIGGFYLYQHYHKNKVLDELSTPVYSTNHSEPVADSINISKISNAKFSCDGRKYCSQMNSLEEARFFVKNCPDTKMDGDNDGEPCERDSRFH